MDKTIVREGMRAYFEEWFNEFEANFVETPKLAIDKLFDKIIELSAKTGIDAIDITKYFETAYPEAAIKIRQNIKNTKD